jgi:hypothetical protein
LEPRTPQFRGNHTRGIQIGQALSFVIDNAALKRQQDLSWPQATVMPIRTPGMAQTVQFLFQFSQMPGANSV